jgi:hypothetical protein
MKVTFANESPFDREYWAVVGVPPGSLSRFGLECNVRVSPSRVWRAVQGQKRNGVEYWRVRCKIKANEVVDGEFIDTASPEPFTPHPWVLDEPQALIPKLLDANGDEYEVEVVEGPHVLSSDAAHLRWHIHLRYPQLGMVLEWWTDMRHDDPVMPYWCKLVWSDRTDVRFNRTFPSGSLLLSAGEYFTVDLAKRKGVVGPVQLQDGDWAYGLNDRAITLTDGSGIFLTGNMLCYKQHQDGGHASIDETADPEDQSLDIMNLQAGMLGGVVGFGEWNGRWLAAEQMPKEYFNFHSDMASAKARYHSWVDQPAGHFGAGEYGIGVSPGQTGDQEDFNASKGTWALLAKQAWFVRAMQYASHCEVYRGNHHYESDGTVLRAINHPLWTTWSGVTHYHSSPSPDRLGKGPNEPPGTGWNGYDDQHKSQNNLAAYAMFMDDPLVHSIVEHQFEVDSACYRFRYPNNGSGAARAQGRQIGSWAQLHMIDDSPRWLGLIDARINKIAEIDTMNVSGPIRALQIGGPDWRKEVFLNGELAPYLSMWEHGLAMVGMYKAYKQNPTAALHVVCTKLARTLCDSGWFTENGQDYIVSDMAWNGGEWLPGGFNRANGFQTNGGGTSTTTQEFIYTEGMSGVTTWSFAGIVAAQDFLEDGDSELVRFIEDTTKNGAWDRKSAEWWCIAGR